MLVGVVSWKVFLPNLLVTGLPFLFLIHIPLLSHVGIIEVGDDAFFIDAAGVDGIGIIPCPIALAVNIIDGCLGVVEVLVHFLSGLKAVNVVVAENTIPQEVVVDCFGIVSPLVQELIVEEGLLL